MSLLVNTFLFKGLALNFGMFSSTSFSSSSVLLILRGRARREVWRAGDFGTVRWNFHWWFCHKQIKNLLAHWTSWIHFIARQTFWSTRDEAFYTWAADSVEAMVDVSALWLALTIVSKWNSCNRIDHFQFSFSNFVLLFFHQKSPKSIPEILVHGVYFLVVLVNSVFPESVMNKL